MGTIYYIFDDNGKIYSEDKTRRFTALEGMSLHNYMKTEASRKAYFLKTEDEKGDIIAVQMPEEMIEEYEKERLHQLYLRGFEEEIQLISMETSTGEDESDTLESFIADESEDVFADICKQMNIENLRRALKTLKSNELLVIQTIYLGKKELSVREAASQLGIPFMTVQSSKQRALEKLKKFF